MFIGREKEIAELETLYASCKFEFAVIYGRRRVGKTALITEFIKEKPAIYFSGVETNAKQNLENFSSAVFSFEKEMYADTAFASFQAALEYVFVLSEKKKFVLVIDEYPYVARASKSLASTLQLLIDKHKNKSKMLLILCGSSMSYMEDKVLAYKAPLYGRRSAQLKIQPFDFNEVCRCIHGMKDEEKAVMYGAVGGTPQYVLQIDGKESAEKNIKKLFLNPASAIYEEPLNLLKQEVREPSIYNAVISAIASGASRMSEISGKVGENTSVCTSYINNLVALGIIKKETPCGVAESRKSIYSIEDNMFRFWYRFIPENVSVIERGASDIAYRRIAPRLSDYMGSVFEEICKQYLWRLLLADASPVEFNSLGRWWGSDPNTRRQEEIDIMGVSSSGDALFGECKWTNEKTPRSVLDTLIYRSSLFDYKKKQLFLFSKSGFTKSCIDAVKQLDNVTLVTYRDILEQE